MSNPTTVQPGSPMTGNRRRRARVLTGCAGVLVAAGAMVATALVVGAPAGASIAGSAGADLQAVGSLSTSPPALRISG